MIRWRPRFIKGTRGIRRTPWPSRRSRRFRSRRPLGWERLLGLSLLLGRGKGAQSDEDGGDKYWFHKTTWLLHGDRHEENVLAGNFDGYQRPAPRILPGATLEKDETNAPRGLL